MKALVYVDVEKVEIRDVEKPKIGSDEVLIKTKFATLCGTDESILEGKFPAKTGVILGHEASGIVEEVGGGCSEYEAWRTSDLRTVFSVREMYTLSGREI